MVNQAQKKQQKKTIKGAVGILVLLMLAGAFFPMLQDQISDAGVGMFGTILILMLLVGIVLAVIGWALKQADMLWCDNMDFEKVASGMIMAILTVVIGLIFFPMISAQSTQLSEDHYVCNGEIFGSESEYEEEDYVADDCEETDAILEGASAQALAGQIDMFYLIGLVFVAVSWGLRSIDVI